MGDRGSVVVVAIFCALGSSVRTDSVRDHGGVCGVRLGCGRFPGSVIVFTMRVGLGDL